MPNYSYTLYSNSESREFTYLEVTGTVSVSMSVYSTDAVVREGTQLQIVFNASESDNGAGGGLGAYVAFDVFGTNEGPNGYIKNESVSKTVYKTYNLSSLGPPSSATSGGYDHNLYAAITPGGGGSSSGTVQCQYEPNIPPVVSISALSQIYAGSTIKVRTVVSDYESDKMESGYSNMSYNSRVEAVYTVNGSTRTVVVNPALGLGTTDTNVTIPSDYTGGKVYFRAYARDATSQSTDQTTAVTILYNNPPSAVFNITGIAPGNTATISWTYNDAEGHSVTTSSLTRYYQAKNSSTWQTTSVSVTSASTSANDFLPLSYNGGTIYYLLRFKDQYGATAEQKSSNYVLQTVTPPTAPPSITYPESVNGGESITVSWEKSTDVENNISGYEVDRTYNGSTWTNIYRASQPNTTSISTLVEYGQSYVTYRVRAYDTTGMYSDYTVGETSTVINNQRPSTPSSITVPVNISTGQAIVIKWGASTDPDGDTITYVLERKVNRGSYTVVAQTQNLNYTDTVGDNWQYVQYRVKAVDSHGLSSSTYKESAERTVNQNHVPSISCQYSNNQDLGVKTELFSFTYSVNDTDQADTLTVKEYLDGTQIKSFTATRNTTYTFNFVNGSKWEIATNGDHVIKITVSDGKATTSLTLTFTKAETGCTITLTEPIESDDNIYYAVLSISYTLPYDMETAGGSFNNMIFNSKFSKVDVYCIGATDTPSAGDWEDCRIDITSSYTQQGRIFIQGNNMLIAMREGHVIFIHKFTTPAKQFNYRIFADTGNSDVLGHICSVQGTFGFSSITFPS